MQTTWEFYQNTFGGQLEDEARFDVLQPRALLTFDRLTFDRLKRYQGRNLQVELVICQLIDLEDRAEKMMSKITSENIDGYSVTYQQFDESKKQEDAYLIASQALAHTGIMDRSLRSDRFLEWWGMQP